MTERADQQELATILRMALKAAEAFVRGKAESDEKAKADAVTLFEIARARLRRLTGGAR